MATIRGVLSKVNRRAAVLALLTFAAGCSSGEPGKDPSALREAKDCAGLIEAYVTAERDTIVSRIDAITKDPDGVRPDVAADAGLAKELDSSANRLGCAPEQWAVPFYERVAAVARDAGHDMPEGPLKLVSAQATDGRFGTHTGRVYMFSMFPEGRLTGQDGAPADLDYHILRHEYVDEAGVTWVLWPDWQAAYHQPAGASGAPNKKFTAVDSTGGSFEAILMPDGATPTQPARPPYRYETGNWLTTGPLIGTYNYADSHVDHFWSGPLKHYLDDMRLHNAGFDDYPEPPRERWIDPRGDWETFVPRFLRARAAIADGAKVIRGQDGSLTIEPEGAGTIAVEADIYALLHEWLDASGLKVEGPEREAPIAAFNRLTGSGLPACGPKPSEQPCLSVKRDTGGEAVLALASGYHYYSYFQLRFEAGAWRIADEYDVTISNAAPVPDWLRPLL